MATETTIFQASDLNRRGRAILDTARGGLARIRDTDGASLIVTREDVYETLREQVTALRQLADAMASFITLDCVLDDEQTPVVAELGSWTWVRHLPPEDAVEFVHDIAEALYASCREKSSAPVAAALDDHWRATAEALSDPLSRETLLGSSSADDYVEVARPERPADDAAPAQTGIRASGS